MFGAVLWVNGNPILDGMPIFTTKQKCLDFIFKKEALEKEIKLSGIETSWTIIRLTIIEESL